MITDGLTPLSVLRLLGPSWGSENSFFRGKTTFRLQT
jgi:hypothetical protein